MPGKRLSRVLASFLDRAGPAVREPWSATRNELRWRSLRVAWWAGDGVVLSAGYPNLEGGEQLQNLVATALERGIPVTFDVVRKETETSRWTLAAASNLTLQGPHKDPEGGSDDR